MALAAGVVVAVQVALVMPQALEAASFLMAKELAEQGVDIPALTDNPELADLAEKMDLQAPDHLADHLLVDYMAAAVVALNLTTKMAPAV